MDYESFRGAFEPENLSGFFEDSEQNFFGTFGQNTILVTDTYEITLTYIDPNRTLLSIYNIKTSETQEAYLISGKTMNSLSQQFYLSTSATSLIGGEWANEKPTIPQYKYLWTRFHIIFNDDTTYDTVASYDTASNEEVVRERNEADRITAEYARRDAESRRVAAEGTRYEAEQVRAHDENDRIRAENTRQTNETIREQSYATARELAQSVRDDADAGLFDGYSPSAEVTKTGNISTLTVTDRDGTTTTTIEDGADGGLYAFHINDDGDLIVEAESGAEGEFSINDDGDLLLDINSETLNLGHVKGTDGEAGFSPTATVTKSGNTATITITDADGTTTAQVNDGPQIDDTNTSTDKVWSSDKIADELSAKQDVISDLDTIKSKASSAVQSINNKTGNNITLTPADIGIGSVFTFKGSVNSIAALPSSGNIIGDVYYVKNESVGYIWLNDGSTDRWEQLGPTVDLSAYATKQELTTHTSNTNVHVTDTEKATWSAKADENDIPDIDATLTQPGAAADAKATGDEITEINDAYSQLHIDVERLKAISNPVYTSMAQIADVVRHGTVETNKLILPVGDQIVMPWKDLDDNNHNTDETAYQVAWDIVRHGIVTLQDGSQVPGMFLQMHKCSAYGVQFSHPQAFFQADTAITAGTYHIGFGVKYSSTFTTGTTGQFTLTQALPVGGRLFLTGSQVQAFASATASTPTEAVNMTIGDAGTSLGTISSYDRPSADGLNSMSRIQRGHNRWSTSAIRQYLNASGTNWFTSKEDFEIRPTEYTKHGFMSGFNSDFLNAIRPIKVTTALNTVEGYTETTEDTYDTFFLPSLEQMNIQPQLVGAEGDTFEYWQQALGTQSFVPVVGSLKFDAFKIPAINNSTAQDTRSRSNARGSVHQLWTVYSTGYVGNGGSASYNLRFCPVCVVC